MTATCRNCGDKGYFHIIDDKTQKVFVLPCQSHTPILKRGRTAPPPAKTTDNNDTN